MNCVCCTSGRGGEQGLLHRAIAGQHIGHPTSKKTSMVTGSGWCAQILQTRTNIIQYRRHLSPRTANWTYFNILWYFVTVLAPYSNVSRFVQCRPLLPFRFSKPRIPPSPATAKRRLTARWQVSRMGTCHPRSSKLWVLSVAGDSPKQGLIEFDWSRSNWNELHKCSDRSLCSRQSVAEPEADKVCSLLEGPFGPEQSQREDLEAGDAGVAWRLMRKTIMRMADLLRNFQREVRGLSLIALLNQRGPLPHSGNSRITLEIGIRG